MIDPIILLHLLVGPLVSIIALIFIKYPPKKINSFYGYRTSSSMKNQQNWDKANKYSSKAMLNVCIATTVVQIIGELVTTTENAVMAGCVVLVIGLLLLIPLTEMHLKSSK